MSLDLDFEFRLALFDHVDRLAREGGGRIPSARLTDGIVFQGARVPIWNPQQGIYRPALLRDVGAATTIQTSFDGPYDDESDGPGGTLSYRYQGTDPLQRNNVALRRAMELGRRLLYLIAVQPGIYEPVYPCLAIGERPEEHAFSIVVNPDGLGIALQPGIALADPVKAYATRQVLQRLHQQRFRHIVIKAYATQCAVCRLRHYPLLEAAHIIGDREKAGRPELPNGLALCKIHHGAYDANILGISPRYNVEIREDILEEHDGPMLQYGLQAMHGRLLHLPRAIADRPKPEYLAIRFDRFRAA
jgi:putative restriction endonuclease